jgi:hypothetical protein
MGESHKGRARVNMLISTQVLILVECFEQTAASFIFREGELHGICLKRKDGVLSRMRRLPGHANNLGHDASR